MKQSNYDIAISIAETVYSLQSDSDSFYGHLIYEHGISEKFSDKILANEDHKNVMQSLMTADILGDIIADEKGFKEKHYDKDAEGYCYDPDDIDYDFRMTDYIVACYADNMIRTSVNKEIGEETPKLKFRVQRAFVSYGYVDVEAMDEQSAKDIAEEFDGGDFITMDDIGETYIESAYEIDDADEE